jgi:heme/copper-type cytochrome/quinol oxidase subunit 3
MRLFLASLGMLFVSGMLLYVLFRSGAFGRVTIAPIVLPPGTWVSTLVLIAGSVTIHRAVVNIRRDRFGAFRAWLNATTALAAAFLAIQFPCLWEILGSYRATQSHLMATHLPGQFMPMPMDGLVFCLILLHALHVVGGIIAMSLVTANALRGRYDHESYMGVANAALYWHFLDVVWIVMFLVFRLTS